MEKVLKLGGGDPPQDIPITLDWVPILLQKFQLLLLAVILLYSPVGLTPLKNIH